MKLDAGLTRLDLRRGPISWMARNPVASNLLMLALLVGGLIMAFRVPQEVFPQFDLDFVMITVPYPGASPAEVEKGVLMAVEEAVRPLEYVKEVRSTALESAGTVSVELKSGTDRNKALADVKNAIDRITSFPQEIERPIVMMPERRSQAISLVIYGDQEHRVLHSLGERVREELLALPDVNSVELNGIKPLEIAIEVPQEKLREHGLTLPQLAERVRRTALELPAGGVKTDGGEFLLRTAERRDLAREFAAIPVVTGGDGQAIRLQDIATLTDDYADVDMEAQFEGRPAVLLDVYATIEQSPAVVAQAVKAFAERLRSELPPGVQAAAWNDMAKLYDERLDLLLRNAMQGLVLVLIILGLFLELRLAFWVTMAIPMCFLGTFLLLPALGITLNMISLFGFIVTLGMVVDDAIVVGENVFRYRRQGMPFRQAAIVGVKEVATPVFFAVATTIAAFAPLLNMPGMRGKFMLAVPVVVILVLFISLIECFFVLPSHLAHLRDEPRGLLGFLARIQGRFSNGVERFVERFYLPFARAAVRQRWLTLATATAVCLATAGMITGGRIKVIDMPREESDWVIVEARLPFGVAVEDTRALLKRLVESADRVIEEHGGKQISLGTFSALGFSVMRGSSSQGGHVASAIVTLVPSNQRKIGSAEFGEKWRQKLGDVPGLESLTINAATGRYSKPIDLELHHSDIPSLESAALELAEVLGGFEGVKDIDDGIELGKPQLDFTLSPDGVQAGLTSAELASQVRASFYGAEALRQQRGRNELKVMVRLPESDRRKLHTVEELVVRTPDGGEMPLRQATRIEPGRAYTTINRVNGQRTARVQAEVDDSRANAQEVIGSVFQKTVPELKRRYPGLGFGFAGRQREMKDFNAYLLMAFGLTLLAMFALIAVPIRSFVQPVVVVLSAVPFGLAGAVWGHWLLDMRISLMSMMGMVALAGVVVNDAIVLTAAGNRFRAQGMSPAEAAAQAAAQRFRPILLTSLTTFGGLGPMIFETSVQARILVPMAVGLGFGILGSTLGALTVTPGLFAMGENLRLGGRRFRAWLAGDPPPAPDAPLGEPPDGPPAQERAP